MSRPIKISMQGVCKSFGQKRVLDNLNLDIKTGQSMVIIGGSGTGKSVTIKCIQGLLTPDSGSILIDDQETLGISDSKRENINRQIGMLFQGAALFDSLPVWENVCFGLLAEGEISRNDAPDIAAEKLALVGLSSDVLLKSPADLSGGMQKRVGLARAIAGNPEIIFFDEPTTGLDPIMADLINNLIQDVNKEIGATALTITHDMQSAKKIGDRIALLYAGNIVWVGDASDIDHTDNPYIEQFINGATTGPIKIVARN